MASGLICVCRLLSTYCIAEDSEVLSCPQGLPSTHDTLLSTDRKKRLLTQPLVKEELHSSALSSREKKLNALVRGLDENLA